MAVFNASMVVVANDSARACGRGGYASCASAIDYRAIRVFADNPARVFACINSSADYAIFDAAAVFPGDDANAGTG